MDSPASTPSSAGSPSALAPYPSSLVIKSANSQNMNAPMSATTMGAPAIVTQKEWVIPPRPKPGRKPATDTPPTKRKAQNRAAQRAFRERRAARVGELEDEIEDTRKVTQQLETTLREKIAQLEIQLQGCCNELQSWKIRCNTLDELMEYEKNEKNAALKELAFLRNGSQSKGSSAVPLPPRNLTRATRQNRQIYRQQTPDIEETPTGCGKCSAESRCACTEEILEIAARNCEKCNHDRCQCLEEVMSGTASQPLELKRSHSPALEIADKRQRQSEPSTPLEIDFTTQFASKPTTQHIPPPSSQEMASKRPIESCGFCSADTYCMCAEAAASAAREQETRAREQDIRLPPILSHITPPPSDTDVEGTIRLPPMYPVQMHRPVNINEIPENSCANGPGTCQQCQSDPKSGLFCRSLAAMREAGTAPADGGCCGGNAGGGGCCKKAPSEPSGQQPPRLSIADTYKTLSTHKNFDQATDELNTWLGRLHASPTHQVAGRAPMEVEAASVMGVLKLFDRRFGRG